MIKYLVMDVDGTLTDGKIYIGRDGELMKAFNVKDGYGIHYILPEIGVIPVIITGRTSKIVSNRCDELGIEKTYLGITDKYSVLIRIVGAEEYLSSVAYIGDDINDLSCMQEIKRFGGLIGCPSDASNEIIRISDFVSHYEGGNGAVREFIEYVRKYLQE